jgi:fatty-acyl-CoA synthase
VTIDQDRNVTIVGRSKNLILGGGENVYPREIQEFLYSHPEIKDVQIVGVPERALR